MKKTIAGAVALNITGAILLAGGLLVANPLPSEPTIKAHDNTVTYINTVHEKETLTGLEDYDVEQVKEDLAETIQGRETIYINGSRVDLYPNVEYTDHEGEEHTTTLDNLDNVDHTDVVYINGQYTEL